MAVWVWTGSCRRGRGRPPAVAQASNAVALDARLGLAGTAEIHQAIRRYRIVFEHLAEADLSHADRRTA